MVLVFLVGTGPDHECRLYVSYPLHQELCDDFGNVGTGVAVAGAFSLVCFRSVPGTAKEICALFLTMGAGLITGMGYLGFALLFTLILSGMFMLYHLLDLGDNKE